MCTIQNEYVNRKPEKYESFGNMSLRRLIKKHENVSAC